MESKNASPSDSSAEPGDDIAGTTDVWWDEPEDEDPANPMNWSSRKKWTNILTISVISFLV